MLLSEERKSKQRLYNREWMREWRLKHGMKPWKKGRVDFCIQCGMYEDDGRHEGVHTLFRVVIGMRDSGLTTLEISRQTGIPLYQVNRVWVKTLK